MFKRLVVATSIFVAASAAIAQSLPEMRMTPAEIRKSALGRNQIGHQVISFGGTKTRDQVIALLSIAVTARATGSNIVIVIGILGGVACNGVQFNVGILEAARALTVSQS